MREHYDMAQMSKALATICTDSPIEFSYEKAKLGNLYTKEAFLLCRQLEFKNLLNRFDSAAVQEDTLEQEFSHVQTWQAVKRCLRKRKQERQRVFLWLQRMAGYLVQDLR